MKGLLLKDTLVASRQAKIYAVLGGFYLVYCYMIKDSTMLVTIGAMLSFFALLNSFSYDEKCKWDNFALTMPISRKMIVLGKYLFGFLSCIVVSIVCAILAIVVLIALGNLENLVETLGYSMLVSIALVVLLIDAMLPIIFKLGVEKARYFIMAIVMLPVIIILLLGNASITLPVIDMKILLIGGIVGIILITMLSYFLSLKFMKEKEF